MKINATLPEKGRDLRLDLFRGVANWAIFLDHIPDNVVNWITTRNYGFSDAADLFVFISGYTASFVYARMMLERGFIVGATRLTKRVWQLYVAHIILFVIYIVSIGYVALRFSDPEIINEFNVAGLVDSAVETLRQGLLLKFKPVNLDVLPLYMGVVGLFPPGLLVGGAVCVRLLVGGRRLAKIDVDHRLADYALFLRRLSHPRPADDHGGQVSGFRKHVPALALFNLQPQRQDQSRALSLHPFRRGRDF